ncbi:unnamed protein product [Calypogeia fissa]
MGAHPAVRFQRLCFVFEDGVKKITDSTRTTLRIQFHKIPVKGFQRGNDSVCGLIFNHCGGKGCRTTTAELEATGPR